MSSYSHDRVIIIGPEDDNNHNMSRYEDEELYDDYDGDELSSYESDISDEMIGQEADADEEADPNAYKKEEEEHVDSKILFGVQTRNIVFRAKGTLEQFNRVGSLTNRRLGEKAHKHMKQVTSMTGRSNITDENTAGNVHRIILLGARIHHIKNSINTEVAYIVNKNVLVPQTLTDTGECYTGLLEANTSAQSQDFSIFAPTNIFAQRMLERWERKDPESLETEFIFRDDTPDVCLVRVLEGKKLSVSMDLIKKHPKRFPAVNIPELVRSRISDEMPYSQMDIAIGRELYEFMQSEIEKISQSFTSVDEISLSFKRADGQDWNMVSGLIGEAALLEPNKQGEYKKMILNSERTAAVHMELIFVPIA